MKTDYDPNMGFQGKGFQSGDSVCKPINELEYYNTHYTPMFDGKGGAAKKAAKKPSRKPTKKPSSKKPKRGGADYFDEFSKLNISLPYDIQTGGTHLASEYYTSAQQGSYAPYNASKNEKCGGGRKGGGQMDDQEGTMTNSMDSMDGTMATAKSSTGGCSSCDSGGCGCGLKSTKETSGMMGGKKTKTTKTTNTKSKSKSKSKSKTTKTKSKSKTKCGGSGSGISNDGYYANTLTGDTAVKEHYSKLDGQLDGGSSKKKKVSKQKGGDDSAGTGSDFKTTLASRGPSNYPDAKSADLFRIFNKTGEFIPNSMLKYAAAPVSTGYAPDPNPYPLAYNDDFIGGTKKAKKPAKKSSSSKTKAKKPAKKSSSSKTKAKKPAKKPAKK